MSFSTHWADPQSAPPGVIGPILITRLFTADAAEKTGENVGLMRCGGYGTIFYPDNPTNAAECPGTNIVKVNRELVVAKDVHVNGRLFVNGVGIR